MKIKSIHQDIRDFINNLDDDTNAKVLRMIEMLSIKEYQLGMPYSKKIEKDIYELRAKSIQNIRIFYTFSQNSIILLYIISKKTQKLRKGDLETARQRLRLLQ